MDFPAYGNILSNSDGALAARRVSRAAEIGELWPFAFPFEEPLKTGNRHKGNRPDLDDLDLTVGNQFIELRPPDAGDAAGFLDSNGQRLELDVDHG